MNFNLLIRQTSMIENNMVGVERIMEYQSGLPQEASWELPSDPPAADWPSEGAISLRQLSTRYREGLDLVLKDISLEVAGGEKVGKLFFPKELTTTRWELWAELAVGNLHLLFPSSGQFSSIFLYAVTSLENASVGRLVTEWPATLSRYCA